MPSAFKDVPTVTLAEGTQVSERKGMTGIYVDPIMDFGWRLGPSCHLTCDYGKEAELHDFAARIGMKRGWFQPWPKASINHYDLTVKRRAAAVKLGVIELDRKQAHAHMKKWQEDRRKSGNLTEFELSAASKGEGGKG